MAAKIVKGCAIFVPATYLDGRGTDKWPQQQFGDRWSTARCSGVMLHVFQRGKLCRVKWDVDGAVTQVHVAVRHLRVDKCPDVNISRDTDVSGNEDGPEMVGIQHGESRQGETSAQNNLPTLSDDDNSSSIEESCSSESVSSDDTLNLPKNGCGRKARVRLCCALLLLSFL